MKRILVFGCPGSGKTKLAKRLGAATGYEVFHIQDHTLEKYTPEKQEFWIKAIEKITMNDTWVIEGTQIITYSIRISRADTVVFLNTKTLQCLKNLIRRSFTEDDIRITCQIIRKILRYRKKIKPYIEKLIKEHEPHLIIYRINSQEELEEFLDHVRHKI
ncbi:MAG: AAA family ATPase [Clostridia bacterium]